jgi:hypothetical protein
LDISQATENIMCAPESRTHEVFNASYSSPEEENNSQDFKQMIDQLKRILHESDSRCEKVNIVTVLLMS